LRNDTSFFYSRKKEINYWLNKTGINQVFYLDKIDVKKNKLTLDFASSFQTLDSLNVAWNMLSYSYDSTDNQAIARKIFNSMAFEMEVGKDSLEVNLASNMPSFGSRIYYNNKYGISIERSDEKSLSRTFNIVSLSLAEFDMPETTSESIDNMSVRSIRNNIRKFLEEYYKEKGTFWYDANMEVLQEAYNELTFEVNRLSREILNDRNYFEYIKIEVKILKRNEKVDIKYDIMGKFSGGFGFEPRRSEFRNMEPDYLDYLRRYQMKLSRKIKESLIRR